LARDAAEGWRHHAHGKSNAIADENMTVKEALLVMTHANPAA